MRMTVEVKQYFKKYIECINLEQNAETDRIQSQYKASSSKDTNLKIIKIDTSDIDGAMKVILEKPINGVRGNELQESSFVNIRTINNISFSKGFISKREFDLKPLIDLNESKM